VQWKKKRLEPIFNLRMDFLSSIAILLLVWLIVCLVLMLFLDADITTSFYDRFGGNMAKKLSGQVIWITGASSGIGAALAIEAVKYGAKVVISARRGAALEEVKARCMEVGRYIDVQESDILVLPLDMCDMESHRPAFNKVMAHFGKVSMLVNNAGRSQRARWEYTDIGVDRDLFDINVFSVVNLTRVVLPHMLERGGGTVAVMSSSAGKAGVPFSGTYTGSKHAIHGYFESLRTEKIGTGVKVCLLCPGPTFSNLLEVAATEQAGQSFGGSMSVTDKRMTAERCAHLSLVALSHQLTESWICFFPVLPLMYFSQYLPTFSKWIVQKIGPKYLAKVRDSRNAMEDEKEKAN